MRDYPVIDVIATGKNIRMFMDAKDISVRDVQVFLGLSAPQSIYHWLDGKCLPTIDHLYALSELLGVPMDELIMGNRKTKRVTAVENRVVDYYSRIVALLAS